MVTDRIGLQLVLAMFWEVFAYLSQCYLLLKLRLDVVLGDSSAPLSLLANIHFNKSGKISTQSLNDFLSVSLKKFMSNDWVI